MSRTPSKFQNWRVVASRVSGFSFSSPLQGPGCKVYLPTLSLEHYPGWNPCKMSDLGCAGKTKEDRFVGGDARTDRRQPRNDICRSSERPAIRLANGRLCVHGCSRKRTVPSQQYNQPSEAKSPQASWLTFQQIFVASEYSGKMKKYFWIGRVWWSHDLLF